MERNVPLKVPLCQHVTLFNDQVSVSVVIHFVLCDLLSIHVCVHKHLLGCCAPWQALAAPQCSFQEPHPQEKWRCWVSLICFQTGTRLTSILSREPQRTKNMHSVSTTQAPVVERRSETDWLTAAVGMAQARDETWWHVLVGFVPPTAEVSCCGTFLLEIRCFYWVYKQWEGLGHCPPGSLGSCVGPLAEWCSTNADHQHKTRWQSVTLMLTNRWDVKHLISLCDRSRCCHYPTGITPVSAPTAADRLLLQHGSALADFFLPHWGSPLEPAWCRCLGLEALMVAKAVQILYLELSKGLHYFNLL